DHYRLVRTTGEREVVYRTRRLHAGQGTHTLQHLIEELCFLGRAGELLLIYPHVECEDIVLVEPGIDGLQLPQTSDHQSCSDQQDEGESNLNHHKGGAGPAASALSIGAAEALFEGLVYVPLGHGPGGQKAGEDAGRDRERKGEGEYCAVEADVAHARQFARKEL